MKLNANKKKVIILVSLVLLLVATGCLNYFLTVRTQGTDSGNEDVLNQETTTTFFSSYRDERTNTRAQEILYLDEIIASATSDEVTIQQAKEKKLNLVDNMEAELTLESLIKAKGFEDCVVTISTKNVNVVVNDSDLSVEEAAQIYNVIVGETEYSAGNVIIIPYV